MKPALRPDLDPEVSKCRDKRVYASRKLARAAARKLKGIGYGGARHVYQCPHCQGFHLTHRHNEDWDNGRISR